MLYWMQQSQRAEGNHALEYAIEQGNERGWAVVVGFGLTVDYPEANLRHYAFMLQGLRETARALRARGVSFVLRLGSPEEVALELGREAGLVVCDRGYLLHQRRWRERVADAARVRVVEVESDVVVPVEEVSDKAEYAARTIRPKIQRLLEKYLVACPRGRVKARPIELAGEDLEGIEERLKVDRSVGVSKEVVGGSSQANRRLKAFVATKLKGYATGRNEPAAGIVSHMSPYLHFGQISALQIALAVREANAPAVDREAFLEELIVRRELGCNFVQFTPGYWKYEAVPAWARRTLKEHVKDRRPAIYSREQLEAAETDDPYWNAAMREMLRTGYMHNYMRMYWGKRVIGWKRDPEEAFEDLLYLNNRYFIDGRDPNAWMNVAWCFGLHDRPWRRRPIYGTVRYMNAAGLERKFDMAAYVAQQELRAV